MLDQLLSQMVKERMKEYEGSYDISRAKEDIKSLNSRMDSYDKEPDYQVGDIIEWKPGLRDCGNKFPAYGQPVYCVSIDTVREVEEKRGPGTSLDYQDMTFCIYHNDLDAVNFFTGDSRRFRKYRAPSE